MSSAILKDAIRLLIDGKPLSIQQTSQCIQEIMNSKASPAQVGAFLVAFGWKNIAPEPLHACAQAMSSFSIPCSLNDDALQLIDIVGTGGDGMDTFNVSTAASFVVASLGGSPLFEKDQKKKRFLFSFLFCVCVFHIPAHSF
jgi:anthranilate phosphoribosyltransferase